MSNLKLLIDDIKSNPEFFENNEMVVECLEELNAVIGHRKLKDSICDQIGFIIGCKKNSRNLNFPMLHTVLTGPPGVGKSTLGEILAKIWYSLDVIEQPTEADLYEDKKENVKTNKTNQIKNNQILKRSNYDNMSLMLTLVILFILITPIILILIVVYYYYGYNGLSIAISALFLLTFVLYFFCFRQNTVVNTEINIDQNENTANQQDRLNIQRENKQRERSTKRSFKDVPFTIARREDFIGKYMGHTVDNTSRILKENLGGVLFIDEAYSLATDERDTFGIECINVINQFLTENKGKIIVIFAGYHDKIHNGPFKYQPGLLRRFIWHIECEGYTPLELFKIFKYQVHKKQLTIKDEESAKELFLEYGGCFPNYGGDTENVVFFSEIKNYKDLITGKCEVGVLETSQIRAGIERMLENNPRKKENPIEKLLSNMDASNLYPDEDIINRVSACLQR